jgi:hypothetical protein
MMIIATAIVVSRVWQDLLCWEVGIIIWRIATDHGNIF